MAIRYLSGINVDSNTLFVDDANNRVGIGTGSPVSSLNINNGDAWINVNDTLRGLQFGYAGPSHGSYRAAVMGGAESYGGTDSGMLTFHTQNGYVVSAIPPERMRITSAGNVGIGTTSPSDKLTVAVGNVEGIRVQSSNSGFVEVGKTGGARWRWANDYNNSNLFELLVNDLAGGAPGAHVITVNGSNGAVGIGTTTPGYKLDVNGVAGASGFTSRNFSVGVQGFSIESGDSAVTTYRFDSDRFRFFSGNFGEIVTILESGNVGIGTTAPTWKLQTESSSSTVAMFRSSDSNTIVGIDNSAVDGDPQLKFYINDIGTFTLGVDDSDSDKFKIGTSDLTTNTRLTIDGSGNVGIGTTSPAEILELSTTTDPKIRFVDVGNTDAKIGIVGSTALGFEVNGSERMRIASTGATRLNAYGSGSFTGTVAYNLAVDSSGNIIETAGGVVDGSGTANYVSKWSDANTLTDSIIYDNGTNVGIGTTSPSYKLSIVGSNPRTFIQDSSTGYPILQLNNASGNFYFAIDNSAGSGFGSAYARYIYSEGAYPIILVTNSAEAMRVTSAGNVGIGTTSPAAKLDVYRGLQTDTITRANSAAYIWGADIGLAIGQYASGPYGTWLQSLKYDNNNSFPLSLNPSGGNVGIGTASPAYKLDVAGTISNNSAQNIIYASYDAVAALFQRVGTYGSVIQIGRSGVSNSTTIDYPADGTFAVSTAGSERMRITAAGNVGIGTTNPYEALDVVGNIRIGNFNTTAGTRYIGYANNTFGNQFIAGMSIESTTLGGNYSQKLNFATHYYGVSAGVRMTIDEVGNVGIGTTAPGAKLQVGGAAKITGGDWPTGFAGLELNYVTNTSYIGSYDRTNSVYKKLFLFSEDLTLETGGVIRQFITSGGNVLIGTTTDNGSKLRVNGSVYADGVITSNTYVSAGNIATPVFSDTFNLGPNGNLSKVQFGNEFQSTNGSYLRLVVNSAGAQNTPVNGLTIRPSGVVQLNQYGAGSFTAGTPTYNLAVDASGNIMELPGGVVDGSGTANKVAKWSDANTITDANITDNGSTVRINSLPLMADSRLAVGTAGADQTYASVFIGGNLTEGSSQYALLLDPQLDGTTNYGMLSNARIAANVTATTAYGIYQINNELLSGATVENNFGIYIANQTSGTTQNWNLYSVTGKNYFGGNVLIGTTTDGGYKLRVNGTGRYDDYLQLWSGTAGASPRLIFGGETTQTDKSIFLESYYMVFQGHNNEGFKFQTTSSLGAVSNRMSILGNGTIVLSNYGSGSKTGTVAYNLAVDASGNVIETAGGVVDGSGTANYVTKWQDANTVTDSQIVDNGTNVGINNASPKTKLDVNGTIGFGSKTLNISDTFVTVLTVNMSNHTGCYVKITAFGDWSAHSAVAYLGEFFLQNGASAYNEPGVIIRQVDNTNTDDIVAQIVDPAGTGTRDFEIQLKTTSASGVPFSAAIQYEVRGQYNSVS